MLEQWGCKCATDDERRSGFLDSCVQNILNRCFGRNRPGDKQFAQLNSRSIRVGRRSLNLIVERHASFITISAATIRRCDCLAVKRKAKKGAKKKAKRTMKRKTKAKKKVPRPAPVRAPEPMPQPEVTPPPMPEPSPAAPTPSETQPSTEASQPSSSEPGQTTN